MAYRADETSSNYLESSPLRYDGAEYSYFLSSLALASSWLTGESPRKLEASNTFSRSSFSSRLRAEEHRADGMSEPYSNAELNEVLADISDDRLDPAYERDAYDRSREAGADPGVTRFAMLDVHNVL